MFCTLRTTHSSVDSVPKKNTMSAVFLEGPGTFLLGYSLALLFLTILLRSNIFNAYIYIYSLS